jgi:fibrillarin-like pre-rRNA processing protein
MLAVKARSIDVTKNSSIIYEQEKETLMNRGFHIEDSVELEPFDKAHAMIIAHK